MIKKTFRIRNRAGINHAQQVIKRDVKRNVKKALRGLKPIKYKYEFK